MTVDKYMNKDVISVGTQATLAEAMEILFKYNIKSLPVVDSKGRLQGIISRRRILQAAPQSLAELQNDTVSNIMETDVQAVDAGSTIKDAIQHMAELSISHFPVLKKGVVVGILSRDNVLSYYVQNLEEKGR